MTGMDPSVATTLNASKKNFEQIDDDIEKCKQLTKLDLSIVYCLFYLLYFFNYDLFLFISFLFPFYSFRLSLYKHHFRL